MLLNPRLEWEVFLIALLCAFAIFDNISDGLIRPAPFASDGISANEQKTSTSDIRNRRLLQLFGYNTVPYMSYQELSTKPTDWEVQEARYQQKSTKLREDISSLRDKKEASKDTKKIERDIANKLDELRSEFESHIANIKGAKMRKAQLYSMEAKGAFLVRAEFQGATLNGANLADATLNGANFSGASLIGANFSSANITDSDLNGTDLTDADITRAKLVRANLTRTKLIRADLTDVDLSRTNLTDADLTGAKLLRAKIGKDKILNAKWYEPPLGLPFKVDPTHNWK